MLYAELEDLKARSKRTIKESEETLCKTLLEDAGVLLDSVAKNAPDRAKTIVSCNMVLRAIGDGDPDIVPMGASQGTVSALGYSQTWTMSSGGGTGELYLSKADKKLLGIANRLSFVGVFNENTDSDSPCEN